MKRNRVYHRSVDDGKTQQHFKEQTDVNNIIAHYSQTGIDPYAERARNQQFGFASTKSYHDALTEIAEVNSAFESLPSAERAEYFNDPGIWLESMMKPEPETETNVSEEASEEASELPSEPNEGDD